MNKLILILLLTGVAAAQPAQPQAQPPAPSEARQCCTKAMNEDPQFAKAIVLTADKQIDQRTLDAHEAAAAQIAENERHVIYAYAAMWVLAVLFIVFLWRRQQALKGELAMLRKELDAAAKGSK
jgi:hypothetical protein